jgi:glucose-6-phosphate-specific signal transduction histidine kinase
LAILNGPSGAIGVGIRGMRERVSQLGGTLTIACDKKGTKVIAVLPVSSFTETDPSQKAKEGLSASQGR